MYYLSLHYYSYGLKFTVCTPLSASHCSQVHLSTDKLGQSVDECDALLKKHEAFERLIVSQEEKVRKKAPSVLIWPHLLEDKSQ